MARHQIAYCRRGCCPAADPYEVCRHRYDRKTLDDIAYALSCSRQAVRTTLETAHRKTPTRYPRLPQRQDPTRDEIDRVRALNESCPDAPRSPLGRGTSAGARVAP